MMKLLDVLQHIIQKKFIGPEDVDIQGIQTDSRMVKQGDLFVCIPGYTVDGHNFAEKAVQQGATALLVEREVSVSQPVTQILVKDTGRALSKIASTYYGYPSQDVNVIGITGTNGKTTTTLLVQQIMKEAGKKTGLIGTMYTEINGVKNESKNTTPDALTLQQLFHEMREGGTDYAIMEMSSHGLKLGRVHGINVKGAAFTNLTQDHLDYHETMDDYKEAKALLFSQLGQDVTQNKYAVLNSDDPVSKEYTYKTSAEILTYGIDQESDVMAREINATANGIAFTLDTFKGKINLQTNLMGKFNVYNVLCAATIALAEGIELAIIKQAIESIPGVSGRFESVVAGQDFHVIVDYAHTPDSLENVLKTAQEFTTGHLYCVVGCGGDRDKTKRPLMAGISTKYAAHSIFTSDNPRSEDPMAILHDMTEGITGNYDVIPDRATAIEEAVAHAQKGDTVIIAGKGHETYQIIGKDVLHFDDREIAAQAIQRTTINF